jgi:hypothetical protein
VSPLQAAIGYARRGLRVIPIEPLHKRPLTEHAVHDSTTDERTILAWFAAWPLANVAIAVPESFRVVDVDVRNGGDVDLGAMLERHGDLPLTVSARTGGGGAHFLLAFPAGSYRGKLTKGIDLLGPGRYFVAAPSVVPVDDKGRPNPNGGRYAWTSAKGTPIAQAPTWLVDLARARDEAPTALPAPAAPPPPDRIERARAYLAKCAPAISGQGGHSTTFLVAQRLVRGFSLDEQSALDLLLEWNQTCQPPWAVRDLRRKVQQAARRGTMQPGQLLNAQRNRS